MIRLLRYWWHRLHLGPSRHPSWRVVYASGGVSQPQTRRQAEALRNLFGPARIVYSRDDRGNLT